MKLTATARSRYTDVSQDGSSTQVAFLFTAAIEQEPAASENTP